MAAALDCLTLPAVMSRQTATVIFMHGLGDSSAGWESIAENFRQDSELQHVKWILPDAPLRPVYVNNGIRMRAWFDIFSFESNAEEDKEGMELSKRQINDLIEEEIATGTDPGRIVLGGFSQGGVMSLLSGLTIERKLAGIVVLSGWLPLRHQFKNEISSLASFIPIFWGHGSRDSLVPVQLCEESLEYLRDMRPPDSAEVSVRIYDDMEHSVNPEECADLRKWITERLPLDDVVSLEVSSDDVIVHKSEQYL